MNNFVLGKERRSSINSWSGRMINEYGKRRRLTLGPGLVMPLPNDLSVPYCYGVVSKNYRFVNYFIIMYLKTVQKRNDYILMEYL